MTKKRIREEELWKLVATHLSRNGIETVLVGGAVASIYSGGLYLSGDIDLVIQTQYHREGDRLYRITFDMAFEILEEIGFSRKFKGAARHSMHPNYPDVLVEFVSGPLGIGEDISIKPEAVIENGTTIYILSPTDCVKDRICSHAYFKSTAAIEQAAEIVKLRNVNLLEIMKWCKKEGRDAMESFRKLEHILN